MNRKTKMAYNAEAKWLVWQKLILCDYYAHTVVYSVEHPYVLNSSGTPLDILHYTPK